MSNLSQQKCVPCEGGLSPMTQADIGQFKPQVPDWTVMEVEGVLCLERSFRFPDFKTAIAFTNQVGDAAEAEGHHPVLVTEWGKTTITWWTHAIGGLHQNDFIMAARTDEIAAKF